MSWSDLSPHWPQGFDAIEAFAVVFTLTCFKIYRGSRMQRRARFIDRFGWSIILFDYAFGLVFFLAFVYTLYPGLHVSVWQSRISLIILLAATIWQAIEIHVAEDRRVQAAAAGHRSSDDYDPPTSYNGPERRSGRERRKDMRKMQEELSQYRHQYGEL